jgi:endonuclease III
MHDAGTPTVTKTQKTRKILDILKDTYPDAYCTLSHKTPFDILVATILSAQCTDARVNIVTQELFQKYHEPTDYLLVSREDLEKDIRSTGFYRNKAKSIQGAARVVMEHYEGSLPKTLEELVKLPGVGRKTANVVLAEAFGIPGITVDTHVGRISRRLGMTDNENPVKVEFDLMKLIPKEDWTWFCHALITHGRRICRSRNPQCAVCPMPGLCRYFKQDRK